MINDNYISFLQVPFGLIGKPVRFWYDPVTVKRESGDIYVTGRVVARPGRRLRDNDL